MKEFNNEYKLNNPPKDIISSVSFAPNSSQFILASSWDGTVRLYDVNENFMRMQYTHNGPVLDCGFQDNVNVFSGGLDNTLKRFNFNANSESIVGSHDHPIRCVEFCPELNIIITGSWDSTVKLWDVRCKSAAGSFAQPERVYTMAICGDKLIVGTANRHILVWDLRNLGYVQQKRDSSLKYQTRCIKAFPNKEGFIISSIEGRVAVEYLDTSPEIQKKKYAFKCHRMKENNLEKIYSVNSLSFNPIYSTFASGGSDGVVNMWDAFNKKRLSQFHTYPTGVTSLSFNFNGTLLAIALSYLGEDGEQRDGGGDGGRVEDIYIRKMTDVETKPKE